MPNFIRRDYFRQWIQRTFVGPWGFAMLVSGGLGIAVSYIGDRFPAWLPLANRAAWIAPVTLFTLTAIPAAIHASWRLYDEIFERFAKAADEASTLRDQLAERQAYDDLATALAHFHREASEGWINLVPNSDQALEERWRPLAFPWFNKVRAVLHLYKVPVADLNHFEVVNNLDIERFNGGINEEVRKMWVRVERLGQLASKYEALSRE